MLLREILENRNKKKIACKPPAREKDTQACFGVSPAGGAREDAATRVCVRVAPRGSTARAGACAPEPPRSFTRASGVSGAGLPSASRAREAALHASPVLSALCPLSPCVPVPRRREGFLPQESARAVCSRLPVQVCTSR